MKNKNNSIESVVGLDGCLNINIEDLLYRYNQEDVGKLIDPNSTSIELFQKITHSFISKGADRSDKRYGGRYDEITRTGYISCPVINEFAETEYQFYKSSRTLYEDMMARYGVDNSVSVDSVKGNKFARTINYFKYYCVDTSFSLYKNIFYLASSRMSIPSKNLPKEHYEINLYYTVPFILYYISNAYYDDKAFRENYSEAEHFIMLDLINSLVLDIITENEKRVLTSLLEKDPVFSNILSKLRDKISSTKRYNKSTITIEVDFMSMHLSSHVKKFDTLYLFREILCMCMSRLMAGVFIYCKKLASKSILAVKSFSDYRMVVLIADKPYTREFSSSEERRATVIDKYYIKLLLPRKENCNPEFTLKIFKCSEALDELKSIVRYTR